MTSSGTFHQQIIESLHELVRSGHFAPGAKFLTEREIAEQFSTSRPTANKALSSLVSAGLLEVRRGAGTFVRESVLDYDLQRLVSFTDKAKAVGKVPGTQLLAFRTLRASQAPTDVASKLAVISTDSLIYMERLRLADETPVIYERRYVSAKLTGAMTKADAKGSLYACWTEKCGLNITGAEETIQAVSLSKAEAAVLQVKSGTACFRILATGHTDGGTPLWYEDTLYRADVYEFRNRIGGLSGTHAAIGKIR
jgi:GntR family transcriptional regulator